MNPELDAFRAKLRRPVDSMITLHHLTVSALNQAYTCRGRDDRERHLLDYHDRRRRFAETAEAVNKLLLRGDKPISEKTLPTVDKLSTELKRD